MNAIIYTVLYICYNIVFTLMPLRICVYVFVCLETFVLTVCPEGMCKVLGPALPMNLFWSLMLANVPLVITASLPLRAPYELNSRGVRLQEIWISEK